MNALLQTPPDVLALYLVHLVICMGIVAACICRVNLMTAQRNKFGWALRYTLMAMYAAGELVGVLATDQWPVPYELAGLFGKASGTGTGFSYSAALKKAAVTWDEQSLDKWLGNPDAVAPMNNMYFHVAKAEQRRDLIAHLKASGK